MLIHGDFINRKGDRITVRIVTKGDESEALEIGDGQSGLYFTDDPADIEDESNDIFDALLTQSASVRLLAERFVPDFFQLSAKDAEVTIYRNGTECLFSGYIEPQTYSQDYNSALDEVELNCIDRLSALQYVNYGGVTNSETYAAAKAAAEQRTFADIIKEALGGGVYFDASKSLNAERPYTLLDDISVNELLFFDDDEDSVWTRQEALEAVLRYLDLHIRQVGDKFYVFAWKSFQTAGEVVFRNIADPGNDAAAVTLTVTETEITNAIAEDCDTSITVGEAYNQIKLTCERKECAELAVSPLEEDYLSAPFPKKTLYAREYVTDRKTGEAWDNYNWAVRLCKGMDGAGGVEDLSIYNYYVQALRNSAWTFRPLIGGKPSEKDAYDLFNENSHSLLDRVNTFPLGYSETVPRGKEADFVPCIVKVWKSDNLAEKPDGKNSEPGKLDDDIYLVIPVRGTGRAFGDGNSDTVSGETYPYYLEQMLNMGGLLQCRSACGGGMLSPVDDETTNYIVIGGKITLQQPVNVTDTTADKLPSSRVNPYTGKLYPARWNCSYIFANEGTCMKAAAEYPDQGDRGKAIMLVKYYAEQKNDNGKDYNSWDCKDGDTTVYRTIGWYDEAGDLINGDAPRFAPLIDGWQMLKFTYNDNREAYDTIDKVAVLDCRIKVGDKYCVETFEDYTAADGRKRTRSIMKWYTYDECPRYTVTDDDGTEREYVKTTFSIGVNPGVGDYIIGQEYDINNTVPALAEIDAEGVALPIKASDRLSGKVEFAIIGPVNGVWQEVYRRHPTLFRRTKWTAGSFSVLDFCGAVYIKDFSINVYSDNGGRSAAGEESDLVYLSDEETAYKNTKEPEAFKINTALSSEECIALGISNAVCLSNPTDATTGAALREVYDRESGETAKPEQMYVDAYYNALRTPKVTMKQNTQDAAENPRDTLGVYRHQAMDGKEFMVRGYSRNLMDGNAKLNLQEI